MEAKIKRRYFIFAIGVLLAFGYLVYGLVNLQIVNGDSYQSTASSQNTKTITLRGSRGMITDADSVILAESEKIYNVTFQRDASLSSAANYKAYTESIIQTIEIIEKYGGTLCVSFAIERDPETTLWTYNFGSGISEEAWNTRMTQWRTNQYLTNSKYDDAETAYNRLLGRYQIYELNDDGSLGNKKIDISEEMILKVMAVYSEMQMNLFLSVPITIAEDVSFSAVSELEGRSMVLQGVAVEVGEKRVYPRNTLASQIIGYTGAITSNTTYYNELQPAGYALNDKVGKDGIEKTMENWLTANISSRQGYRVMEKNSLGTLTREISYTQPQDGNNVKLTIIASYQQEAERCIADNVYNTRKEQEKKIAEGNWLETNKVKISSRDFTTYPLKLAENGVMIVLEISTGKVLAMAQYPTYDLNAMVAGGDSAASILLDERNITMNYAIQTRAEPGSIFKMVTGLAALVNGVITPETEISDDGAFMRYTSNESEAPTCWANKALRKRDHQNQNIVLGLEHSCNYFFYTVGSLMYERENGMLYRYSSQMGLTSKTGIDLPGELRSIVGNQTNLYDQTVSLTEQVTDMSRLVAAQLKKHLKNVGAGYGITYSDERLNKCIKQLMDMAVNNNQGTDQQGWLRPMREILQEELNMTRTMVYTQAIIGDIYNYLNEIKWGGSLEIQMAIGQSITLLTPAAVSRYVAALGNGGIVYNLMIVDSIISPDGEIVSQRTPSVFNQLENVDTYLPYILEGMKGVVDQDGTANKYFKGWNYVDDICAKTGTSQVTIGGVKLDVENNAWFVCLAPYSAPKIAIVTLIPHGYSGGLSSVGAKDFLTWWFQAENKEVAQLALTPGNELAP